MWWYVLWGWFWGSASTAWVVFCNAFAFAVLCFDFMQNRVGVSLLGAAGLALVFGG